MTSIVAAEAASLACALIGGACMIAWPLFATRRSILVVQLGIGTGFGLHYVMEDAFTAAVLNGLSALQVACSLLFGASPRLKWLGYSLIPGIGAACIVTWDGLSSVLSTLGSVLIAAGRVQIDPTALRALVLAGVPFWLAHDLLIGSPLVVADLLSLVMGVVALVRSIRWRAPPLRWSVAWLHRAMPITVMPASRSVAISWREEPLRAHNAKTRA